MKHLNTFQGLILAFLLVCSSTVWAYDFEVNGIFYNIIDATGLTVEVTSGGVKYSGNVVVPGSVEHDAKLYTVTAIGNNAFKSCSGLANVEIPSSVTSIGSNAFNACTSLTCVIIPCNVATIGNAAFARCTNLGTVVNFSSNKILKGDIGNGRIAYSADKVVNAPNGYVDGDFVWFVSDGINYLAGSLSDEQDVVLPANHKGESYSIGDYAFYKYSYLKSVIIPTGVAVLGDSAFCDCSSLASVTIPKTVVSVGAGAFENCENLKSVDVDNIAAWCNIDFENILSNPLYYANLYLNGEATVDLVVPEGVTEIKPFAFFNSAFTSITLPGSLEAIGMDAFFNCDKVRVVYNNSSLDIIAGYGDYGYVAANAFCVVTKGDDTFDVQGDYIFTAIDGIPSLHLYVGHLTEITLPADYKGREYIIGGLAFYDCSSLEKVNIGNGVLSVGNQAFGLCTGLTDVTMGNNVRYIGDGSFYNCTALTDVTFCNGLEYIGNNAFYNCRAFETVEIPGSVKTIGTSAFSDCAGLASVVVGGNVKNIGRDVFYNCIGLTNVTLCDGLEYIGERMFYNCSALENVEIPGSVKTIGAYAFAGCYSLANIEIHNGVTTIEDNTFYNCRALETVGIPSSVKTIGTSAFAGCYSLANIEIPNGVTTIEDNTFSNCRALETVGVPGSVKTIGAYAFAGCNALANMEIPHSVTTIEDNAFSDCTGLASVVVGGNVKNIGRDVFYNCIGLTNVTLCDGLEYIGERMFSNCRALETVEIPGSVKTIGTSAFARCNALANMEIPHSVTTIEDNAFSDCTGLASVVVGGNVKNIGRDVFYNCTGLASVTLCDGLEYIGDRMFYNCSELADIEIPSSIKIIGWEAFHNTAWMNNQPEGVVYLGNMLYGYKGAMVRETSIVIEDGTLGIANYAFSGCSRLVSITIPNSVTTIGAYAFYNCNALVSVEIPASVTTIGAAAFSACGSLRGVILYDGLKYIGERMFSNCRELFYIKIPESVESIGSEAFAYTSISYIDLPDNLRYLGYRIMAGTPWQYDSQYNEILYIEDYVYSAYGYSDLDYACIKDGTCGIADGAFGECRSLTAVEIPASVKMISSDAFYNCRALGAVYIDDLSAWCNLDFETSTVQYNEGEKPIYSNPLRYGAGLYLNGEEVVDLVIPDGLSEVKKYSFFGCSSIKSVTIPGSVKVIGECAFEDSRIERAVIGAGVERIGDCAFHNYYLQEIYLMDDAPADFENAFFEDAYDNAILYVPTGTLAAYQATATWGRFKDIREFDTTGIDDVVCEDDMLVENLSGGVVVPNAIGKDLTVYTPSGKLVERISSYKGQTVALEKGLYIIRTGNGVTKVLVR